MLREWSLSCKNNWSCLKRTEKRRMSQANLPFSRLTFPEQSLVPKVFNVKSTMKFLESIHYRKHTVNWETSVNNFNVHAWQKPIYSVLTRSMTLNDNVTSETCTSGPVALSWAKLFYLVSLQFSNICVLGL